jgi:Flp pilus assembly protein TadG
MARALIHKYCRYLLSWPRGFSGDRSGVVAVLVALAMPVLAGTMGLAAEASYWYAHQRGMQNAADAAAIAAATGANASTTYAAQAQAVASQLGFTNGSGNVTVTATSTNNAVGCQAGKSCYTVAISDAVPLFLSRVIGYGGNAIVNKQGMTAMAASSVAQSNPAYPYCILALGNVTNDIVNNGGPTADLEGCNVMSDTGANCNGHDLNAAVGDAYGTNNGCGKIQNSNVPKVDDPYKGLASNIPADTCGGKYPQEKNKDPQPSDLTQWSGSKSLSGNTIICGDLRLTADTFISAPSNAVLVIENGKLDTNGFKLQTTAGSGLTVVFTAPPADYSTSKYRHIPTDPTNGGILDIAAPTSGPWSGVALYQDPNLIDSSGNLDITYTGNNPAWEISGLIYLPKADVTFKGAVNKASNGYRCFTMVVGTLKIDGTANIFKDNNQCSQAGLNQPKGGNRGTLVN